MFSLELQILLTLIGSIYLASAGPLLSRADNLPLPSKTIFQASETDIWLENVVTRQNGDLLITALWPNSSLFTLREPYSPSPKLDLIHTFDGANGLLGIVETQPDIFVVAAGQFSALSTWVPGTAAVWEISLNSLVPAVRKITDIPESLFLNGIEAVPSCTHDAVLVADSRLGAVWRVNTKTGEYSKAIEVPEMAPIANASEPFGVNGLKIRDHFLYWSNSDYHTIYRIRINAKGLPAGGAEVETVAVLDSDFIDDFVFDTNGTLWAMTNLDNKVIALRPDGSSDTVVGDVTQLTVAGDTAAAFGRTESDGHVLYVVTSGGVAAPVNGTVTEPGKVVAIDTRGFDNGRKE
ncbi:hypothetical protein BJ170DRAFT_623490 [Xylariales sp. AK1849]|nr:hypothetical protein BJ170DRAFT_623490 [Xylariales sp. AK1849]